MEGRGEVLILSSNNYLGLCDEPSVVDAGIDGLRAVRRRHGERALHLRHVHDPSRARGRRSREFVGTRGVDELRARLERQRRAHGDGRRRRATSSCSDALNHASIIDSMRLAKAITKCTTAVYKHADMDDLRAKLDGGEGREAAHDLDATASSRWKAPSRKLPDILQIARDHDAIVVRGRFALRRACLGKTGRGTAEHFGVLGEVDVITSTLGKALGGAAGGFVAGSAALVRLSHAALAAAALLERAAADGRDERARRGAVHRAASGARADSCGTTRSTSASRSPRPASSRSPARRRSSRSSSARRRRRSR